MSPVADHASSSELITDIEQFLIRALEECVPPEPLRTPWVLGRRRTLHELHLWLAVLLTVVRGSVSQTAVWRFLFTASVSRYTPIVISDEAVFRRLGTAGTAVLERLFATVLAILTDRLAPLIAQQGPPLAPFAADVVGLDETTFDKVARKIPTLRGVPKKDHRLLPGKLAGVFDVRRQLWRRVLRIEHATQNEKVAARSLLDGLARGTLILADLGYFAFRWFDELTAAGFFWVSRVRAKASFVPIHTFFAQGETRDELVWVGAYRADQARFQARLVQFKVRDHCYQYLTNVLDPRVLPLADIARLYARRWDIEMAFNLVKTHLDLHALWSAKQDVLWIQVWAVLIVSQILQAMRWEIAVRAGVDVFDVSLPLLVKYASSAAARGENVVDWFVRDGKKLHFIRPARRVRLDLPIIPAEAIVPAPPHLLGERQPRYANKQRTSAT